jgi:hypothetical protein
MSTVIVKTSRGNDAPIRVDVQKYKTKEAMIAAEKDFWKRAYSGVSAEKITDALGRMWDTTHPDIPDKPEKPAKKQDK